MANIFNQIQLSRPKKNSFDLSHERKFSMNMGDLVPVMLQEVIPGDSFRVNMEHLIRMQPLTAPMMHRVNSYTHFFFVPYRLIWKDSEDFFTGGEDGKANPVFPKIKGATANAAQYAAFKPGSLMDYLGVPVSTFQPGQTIDLEISALPFRAYHTVYNEYYRDQNLQTKIPVLTTSGNESFSTNPMLAIQKRAWEKDYFTSALPFAQRGEQLSIPLSQGYVPIIGDTTKAQIRAQTETGGTGIVGVPSGENIVADVTALKSSTINELRSAFSIQKWMEKSARGGSRYAEHILAVFGKKTSDARLNRPEYLGGGKTPIIVSEVMQTSSTVGNSPQGSLAGHGISVGSSNRFSRSFEEHGIIIGIMSVLPRTSYAQGLPKIFTKFDKFDYLQPDLAGLGEQPVQQQELYLETTVANLTKNKKTFGYQPRYAEYRFANSTVHGDFLTSLKYWTMFREFKDSDPRPALNSDFIKSDPTHRVFANTTPTDHKLLVQTYVNCKAIRPLPKFGNPSGL